MNDQDSWEPGCGDSSCIFACIRARGGMRTNGGCRCFKHLMLNTNIQNAMEPTQFIPYNNHEMVEHLWRSVALMKSELLNMRKKTSR